MIANRRGAPPETIDKVPPAHLILKQTLNAGEAASMHMTAQWKNWPKLQPEDAREEEQREEPTVTAECSFNIGPTTRGKLDRQGECIKTGN